jgi:3-deoxy-D-manno-octulosonic-acid transferase
MFFLYQFFISIIIIFSPIILLIRLIKKKEDPERFLEKFFLSKKKRPKGNLIWFHCASVGETMSIIKILDYFEADKRLDNILITTTTISSANLIKKFKYKKLIHQYYPFDYYIITKKFINYWKPNIAIFLEAEIWPSMFFSLKKKLVPLIILNTRLSKKSFKKWMFLKDFAKNIFSLIEYSYPQNKETELFLKKLNVKKIKKIGNLKYIESKNIKLNKSYKNSLKRLSGYNTWVAASTHPGEECFVAKAHIMLKKKQKNLITIIIPRHINYVEKIKNQLEKLNLKVITHNSKKKNLDNVDIYLVDSFGISKSFYELSSTVFLGKSIYHNGGQNPLEAVNYGCNILHGPNVQNFKEVYIHLDKLRISKKVDTVTGLSRNISFNKNYSTSIKIKNIGNKIFKNTIKELEFHIKKCI